MRKLRLKLEQTEVYEQLLYNVSIIQSFVEQRSSKAYDLLFEMVEERQIKVLQKIFENLCQFKNLNTLNGKMG